MHGGGSAPSCCAFSHRVAFEEGSGPPVLLKSGPGTRGRSACVTTHVAGLEFPREDGLILRCAGKAGNPFQTRQGIRLSCRVPEVRRFLYTNNEKTEGETKETIPFIIAMKRIKEKKRPVYRKL